MPSPSGRGELDLKKHAWKIVAVALMLLGIFVYVWTLDETLVPEPQPDQPGKTPPVDAPLTDKPH